MSHTVGDCNTLKILYISVVQLNFPVFRKHDKVYEAMCMNTSLFELLIFHNYADEHMAIKKNDHTTNDIVQKPDVISCSVRVNRMLKDEI